MASGSSASTRLVSFAHTPTGKSEASIRFERKSSRHSCSGAPPVLSGALSAARCASGWAQT